VKSSGYYTFILGELCSGDDDDDDDSDDLVYVLSPSSYSTSFSIIISIHHLHIIIITIISALNRLKERVRSEMITQLGMYHFYCHFLYGRVTETTPIDAEAEKLLFAAPQAEGNCAVRTMTSTNYYFYHYYNFYC
jgi:hypothetical protein